MAIFSKKSKSKKAEKGKGKASDTPTEEEKDAPQAPKGFQGNPFANKSKDASGPQSPPPKQSQQPMAGFHNVSKPPPQLPRKFSSPPQQRMNSGYSRTSSHQAPSFDSPILGNPKMQQAARDRGYVNPHHSADSGYSSAGPSSAVHSRAPSTNHSPQESYAPILKASPGFLPELSLGEELAREPAFSEHSFSEDQPLDTVPRQERQRDVGYFNHAEAPREKSSLKTSRSQRSLRKQARFEEATEPMPQAPAQQESREDLTPTGPTYRVEEPRASASRTQYNAPVSPELERSVPRTAAPAQQQQQQYVQSAVQEQPEQQPMSYGHQRQSSTSSSQPTHASMRRLSATTSRSRRDSMPPLSILDGLKVNKRGRILDEEGDPIGELVEGDIMDCVRQRANAHGEVLDDYGSVVGRVRVLARGNQSAWQRASTPTPNDPNYFQHTFQLPTAPLAAPAAKNESAYPGLSEPAPQPESQELYQRVAPPPQEYLHRFASPPPSEPLPQVPQNQAKAPLTPLETAVVELDASEIKQEPQEPVWDYSEPFMPPPHVPARSPRRSESPPGQPHELSAPSNSVTESTPSETDSSTSERSTAKHEPMLAAQPTVEPVEEEQEAEAAATAPSISQTSKQSALSAVGRSLLGRSGSERTSSFTRPAMPPFPDSIPENKTQNLFSYKGEIPDKDGPPPGFQRQNVTAPRAKAPPLPSFPRQAFTGGLPGGSPFANSGLGNGVPPMSRRVTTNGLPGGMPMARPGMKSRYSTNTPLVRSPLSSHGKTLSTITASTDGAADEDDKTETTPPESDEGSSESGGGDKVGDMGYAKFRAHSRAPSVRTVSSVTSQGKPRTYFTHAGRVTVEAGELPPSAAAAAREAEKDPNAIAAAQAAAEKKPDEKAGKKKSRMSIFGKKK